MQAQAHHQIERRHLANRALGRSAGQLEDRWQRDTMHSDRLTCVIDDLRADARRCTESGSKHAPLARPQRKAQVSGIGPLVHDPESIRPGRERWEGVSSHSLSRTDDAGPQDELLAHVTIERVQRVAKRPLADVQLHRARGERRDSQRVARPQIRTERRDLAAVRQLRLHAVEASAVDAGAREAAAIGELYSCCPAGGFFELCPQRQAVPEARERRVALGENPHPSACRRSAGAVAYEDAQFAARFATSRTAIGWTGFLGWESGEGSQLHETEGQKKWQQGEARAEHRQCHGNSSRRRGRDNGGEPSRFARPAPRSPALELASCRAQSSSARSCRTRSTMP
jgi:hypothetical protein